MSISTHCTTLTTCVSSSVKFEGPWFTTQAVLSSTIGLVSFIVFCYSRTRWPLLFAPRTKLKGAHFLRCRAVPDRIAGFSPHEAHAHTAFFGWIWPTLKTSEYTVLQIVGLDAAVVCNVRTETSSSCLPNPLAVEFLQDVVLPLCIVRHPCRVRPHACKCAGALSPLLGNSPSMIAKPMAEQHWKWNRRRQRRLGKHHYP